jgi:hypothetical protein
VQDNNYSYISSGSPTYWPTESAKIKDLLDFFVTKGISPGYTNIVPSFDLSSDHTSIIATISSSVTIRHNTPRLHKYKTNWEKYREGITNNVNLKIKLKTQEDLELAIETLAKVMQQAATQSTPPLGPQKRFNNIPLKIKQLLKRKTKGKSNVAPNALPTDKTRYNQLINKLKAKLKEIREASVTDYILYITSAGTTTQYGSLLKTKENQTKPHLQYEQQHQLQGPGQEAIKKNPNSLHNTLLTYLLRIMMQSTMK